MEQQKKYSFSQKIDYSFHKMLIGSDLSKRRLAVMTAKSVNPGPVVWITGCGHGDEVGGLAVVHEIFKRLKRTPLLKGEMYSFPLMNPIGFEVISRHVAIGGEDLNRCFPGNPNGSVAQRIAHIIFNEIISKKPSLVLDLHNDWRSSIPYIVLDPEPDNNFLKIRTYSAAREYALKTGMLTIQEENNTPDEWNSPMTLSGSLLEQYIPALTIELGEAYVVNEQNVETGIKVIWNIISDLGMVDQVDDPVNILPPVEVRGKILKYSHRPLCNYGGIMRYMVKPGDIVKPGQPVGKVYNAFGKVVEIIRAEKNGIVIGRPDSAAVFPGVPAMAFGVF